MYPIKYHIPKAQYVKLYANYMLVDLVSKTTLLGTDELVYLPNKIKIMPLLALENDLVPAQNYLLKSALERVALMYNLITPIIDKEYLGLAEIAIDDEVFNYMPPIVECDHGKIYVSDGIHRIYHALINRINIPVTLVYATRYEYYAKPLDMRIANMIPVDNKPEVKHHYTDPENPRRLYRDYNKILQGIQPKR